VEQGKEGDSRGTNRKKANGGRGRSFLKGEGCLQPYEAEVKRLSAKDEYDPDKHDAAVIREAAERFQIPESEAKRIFIAVDGAGLDL
jgi:hypothetical protein